MKVIAAYLLATLGGNSKPDVSAIQKILKSVGANVEDSQVQKLLKELEGKNINEVLEAGKKTTFFSSFRWFWIFFIIWS